MMPNHCINLKCARSAIGAIILVDVPPGAKRTETGIAKQHHQEDDPDKKQPMKPARLSWGTLFLVRWGFRCTASARPGWHGRGIHIMHLQVSLAPPFAIAISGWNAVIPGDNTRPA